MISSSAPKENVSGDRRNVPDHSCAFIAAFDCLTKSKFLKEVATPKSKMQAIVTILKDGKETPYEKGI
jgi:hypothetical protein